MPPLSKKPSAKSSSMPSDPVSETSKPEIDMNEQQQEPVSGSDAAMEDPPSQTDAEKEEGDVIEEDVAEEEEPEEEVEEEMEEGGEGEEGAGEMEEGGEGEEGAGEMEEGGGEEEEAKEVPETINEKRKQKEFEVFVGGLPRDATEWDLEKVFKKVGEVVEVRLAKNSYSNKNKGFAFVRFATVEMAKKAATELKHTMVKGKSCGVIRNNDNETLHVGNICTSWTKEELVEKLKAFDLENLEEVHLIDDPHNKGKNRGYAFLDFSTHMDAVAACSKLQRRGVFFGTDVGAEVSFSKTVEPDEEVMAQVKSVFLDGLPATWDEAQLRELFNKFGEIESVQLARNMPTAKRKDFGFIFFTTREAALDCIEKVNKDGVVEGDDKVLVKATLKRPLQKRTPQMLGVRRGYIGKGFGMRGQQSYGFGRSFPGRSARSHESMGSGFRDRSGRLDRFSSKGVGFKAAMPPPARKYGAHLRRESAREIPDTAVLNSRSRDPYYESSSSGRRTPGSHRYYPSTYSRLRGQYADADDYDPRFEHREAYDHYAMPEYKRPYSELDHDMLASSSLTRRGRTRSGLEMGTYPQHGGSAYDEYSRFLPDEHLAYDRVEYVSREYGSRYLSGSGASRSYY